MIPKTPPTEQRSNFIADCLSGTACETDLPQYIAQWNAGNREQYLYEFLGMLQDEYLLIQAQEENIYRIVESRRLQTKDFVLPAAVTPDTLPDLKRFARCVIQFNYKYSRVDILARLSKRLKDGQKNAQKCLYLLVKAGIVSNTTDGQYHMKNL